MPLCSRTYRSEPDEVVALTVKDDATIGRALKAVVKNTTFEQTF